MHQQRHTCGQCQELIPHNHSFLVWYDAKVFYLYYFCSWWHMTLWLLSRLIAVRVKRVKIKE